jgi:hypothetical protein
MCAKQKRGGDTMNAKDVRFGIEVECYMPRDYQTQYFPRGGYHRGLQIRLAPDGWNCQSDASVRSLDEGYVGIEVVSPILSGEDGLVQAYYMAEFLRECNAKVDYYCGLHVHVDATNLSEKQVQNIARAFRSYEQVFYAFCGEDVVNRLTSAYCKPLFVLPENVNLARLDRYHSLNFTNYYYDSSKKTLEFRMFPSRIDEKYIITAIHMAVALVTKAAYGEVNLKDVPLYVGDRVTQFSRRFLATTKIVPDCTSAELGRILRREARVALAKMDEDTIRQVAEMVRSHI